MVPPAVPALVMVMVCSAAETSAVVACPRPSVLALMTLTGYWPLKTMPELPS